MDRTSSPTSQTKGSPWVYWEWRGDANGLSGLSRAYGSPIIVRVGAPQESHGSGLRHRRVGLEVFGRRLVPRTELNQSHSARAQHRAPPRLLAALHIGRGSIRPQAKQLACTPRLFCRTAPRPGQLLVPLTPPS